MKNYFCEKCEQKIARNGRPFLSFTLNSGEERINASMFSTNDSSEMYNRKFISCIVRESGDYYNIDSFVIVLTEEEALKDPLMCKIQIRSNITPDKLIAAVEAFFKKIDRKYLNFLRFVDYKKMINDFYKGTPGGRVVHHDIENGLIQHIYEMLSIYYNLTRTGQVADLNHGFVLVAILFHDYGKVMEYDSEWKETCMMPILGHIFISSNKLRESVDAYNKLIRELDDPDKDNSQNLKILEERSMEGGANLIITDMERDLITHCILAHHGKLEHGSPVVPCIPEAFCVHWCDILSARLYQFDKANDMEKSFFLDNAIVIKDYNKY